MICEKKERSRLPSNAEIAHKTTSDDESDESQPGVRDHRLIMPAN